MTKPLSVAEKNRRTLMRQRESTELRRKKQQLEQERIRRQKKLDESERQRLLREHRWHQESLKRERAERSKLAERENLRQRLAERTQPSKRGVTAPYQDYKLKKRKSDVDKIRKSEEDERFKKAQERYKGRTFTGKLKKKISKGSKRMRGRGVNLSSFFGG